MRASLLAILLLPAAARADEAAWKADATAHFVIHHEAEASSLADQARVERIYEGLHPALGSLAPWMAGEKTHLYVYRDRDRYLAGRFAPPPWSAGLLRIDDAEKAVASFEPLETATIAHELVHLYLHSFFAEKEERLPPWLDEGLAAMLQDEALTLPDPRRKGPVLREAGPLKALFESRPAGDAPQGWVSAWYQQAASVVWFLRRGHIDGGFPRFCASLRDGESVEASLRKVYGYDDVAAFEKAWLRWRPRKAPGQLNDLSDL